MAKRGRERRPASTTGRLWKLTGMTTSIATRVASHQVKGLFQSEQDRATSREALMRHIGQVECFASYINSVFSKVTNRCLTLDCLRLLNDLDSCGF